MTVVVTQNGLTYTAQMREGFKMVEVIMVEVIEVAGPDEAVACLIGTWVTAES